VLGAGSMGSVYRARQLNVGREVAIKILRQDRSADDSTHARFKREAELIAKLSSPHTVTAFDSGLTAAGEPYLVMELLRGESLGQRLARVRRVEVTEAIDACIQVLRSLSEAHAKGIVHRDLKPDNVYFAQVDGASGAREIVKVLDFGIAKLVGRTESTIDAVETQAGAVFGTPRYMSPEQAQGLPLDARSDLYTLGTILYQMVSGRPLFDDREAVVVMARHIKTTPTPLRELGLPVPIPEELDNLVCDVLAKDPNLRPATADTFAERLLRIYESMLSDSSGMRIARGGASATTSASFVSMPVVALDPPTVMTSAPAPEEVLPPRAGAPRVAVAAFALVLVVAGVAFLALRRAPVPAPATAPSVVAPAPSAAAALPAPAPPSAAEPPREAEPGSDPPGAPARTPKNANPRPPKSTGGAAAPPAASVKEPETPATKPSNGYGIFE
jgi:serine/threonine protein kinase